MKPCSILIGIICLAASLFAAPMENEPKGPTPLEIVESIAAPLTVTQIVNELIEPFVQPNPFLPDPDTVLLIDMHAQIDDPTAGDVVRDLSGNGNHAQVYGAPQFIRHDTGCMNSIQFAEADKLVVAHSPSLDITQQITIEAWIQTNTDMGYLLLKKGSYGFPKFLANHVVFSYFHLQKLNWYPTFSVTQPEATDGKWHYFAATYDGKVIRYYLDGELSKELVQVDHIRSTTSSIVIGHSEGWHASNKINFAGKFSSLRVSNRARSPDEIRHSADIGNALLHGIGCSV
ncbi:uncharacterized protein [Oscarella lobularis]|uniref:uncharacterized protein n=1 Tax=Oscarella lobularis TaxID=121494 RepID=UPI003313F613